MEVWLKGNGWSTSVSWGNNRGIDIDASRGTQRWIIEAKGRGSRPQARGNYFLNVLGKIIQEMDDPSAKYSIALPEMKRYRGLWTRVPQVAKNRLGITAIFVYERGKVEHSESVTSKLAAVMSIVNAFAQVTAQGLAELDHNQSSLLADIKRRLGDV